MHYLSDSSLQRVLKLYGRQLGISDDKLTLSAMRRTAIRLKLDQGGDLEAMRSFLDTREKIKSTRYRLARFPLMPPDDPLDAEGNPPPVPLPLRTSTPLKGDEGFIHGFYSRRKDRRAVEAIMAEAISGVDQEIACLKRMLRHMLDLHGDVIQIADVYTRCAQRLGELVQVTRLVHSREEDPSVEETLSQLEELAISCGGPPVSQGIRQEALGSSPGQQELSHEVSEEIATIRLLLRNLNARLLQGVGTQEYLRLVDLYSQGGVRLLKLIKLEQGDGSRRNSRYLNACIDEAIRLVQQEYSEQGACRRDTVSLGRWEGVVGRS